MKKICIYPAMMACSIISASACAAAPAEADETPQRWAVYGQFTRVDQMHPAFAASYTGQNSLNPSQETKETTDATLYAGLRLSGNSELWINAEEDQGYGLGNTLGLAGFSSGEAYKVGEGYPYFRIPRLFYRKTVNLGGETQKIESAANQLGGEATADNLVWTVGKYSVADVFDTNTYAHDPRADFMNWSVIESGAFDYAADAWGYTVGTSLEWTQSWWTLRAGVFDLSHIPNTRTLDPHFSQYELVSEFEARHQPFGRPGKIKLLAFVNRGNMGSYADAVLLGQQTASTPDTALVRQFSSRPGIALNVEQELAADLGGFVRLSKNNGSKEAFDFTEINQSAATGVALKGNRWGRGDDTVGAASVVNSLSSAAQSYFAAGGMGILIGDGNLNYGSERILETYYALQATRHVAVTFDYQHVANPAYNQDRGPVVIYGARVHAEF